MDVLSLIAYVSGERFSSAAHKSCRHPLKRSRDSIEELLRRTLTQCLVKVWFWVEVLKRRFISDSLSHHFLDCVEDVRQVLQTRLETDLENWGSRRQVQIVMNHLTLAFLVLRDKTARVFEKNCKRLDQ